MQQSKYRTLAISCFALPLLLAACSPDSEQKPVESPPEAVAAANESLDATASMTAVHTEGVPGGMVASEVEIQATVVAIDTETRQFVLQDAAGHQRTVQAPPEMVNFPQLAVGDKVLAKLIVETISYLKPISEAANDGNAAVAVATTAEGQKPGVILAGQKEVVAIVEAIDFNNRVATLKFPDGSTESVAVRSDVELNEAQIGREVVIRTSLAMAMSVVKQEAH